jgi:diguanylate cyclase (GGDEF)-like protein
MSFAADARESGRGRLAPAGVGAACLGAILIALLWLSTSYFSSNERDTTEQLAIRNAMNLAGAFEEHLTSSISDIDRSLQVVRAGYLRDGDRFDLPGWLKSVPLFSSDVLQVSILDRDGRIKLSTLDPAKTVGLNFSDRDHFEAHRFGNKDDLFIGKPVVGSITGKWSIQMSRRLTNPDGSFGGVVVAALDPAYLTRIYNSVNIGVHGHIRVVGIDGVVRATSGLDTSVLGRDYTKIDLFTRYPAQTKGWYYTDSRKGDAIPRLIVFKAVASYPLIIIVGQSSGEIFSAYMFKSRASYLVVTLLSLLIVAVTMFNIRASILRERDEKNLARTNMLLNAMLANMPHGVCMFGPDKKLIVANKLYYTMYGIDPNAFGRGASLLEILQARVAAGTSPRDAERYVAERLEKAFIQEPGEIVDELTDGRTFSISRQAMPGGGSVAIHQDITTQRRAQAKISHLAHYDGLTNLANRVQFLEQVNKVVRRLQSQGGCYAIHLLDLDRFKEVNDSLGHAVGDSLLFEVASRLRGGVGPNDVVARLGGDEFTVLQYVGAGGAAAAIALAEKLLGVISQPFDIDMHRLEVETSIGIVLAPEHGLLADELIKKADLALYRAKSAGRNGWRLFEPDMAQQADSRLALAMDLRKALARDEFVLHYQPVVDTATSAVVGTEALIRWRNPARGMVAPNDFIPLAEDTGLIIPVGEWVLQRACRDAVAWPSDVSVAVNVSAVQMRSGQLVELVERTLRETGLAARRLELEFTESVLLQHDEQNLRVLHELKELGIAIVLDDFGTGYSSLSYLLKFPFDKIKIDRSFVAELSRRDDCAAIVSAVAALARGLDIAITAEGVETAEQLMLLRLAGCPLAQGFLFGRPCPKEELVFEAEPVALRSVAS